MSFERTINVNIKLPPDAPKMKNATVYVQLLDVTLADAPSAKVADEVLSDIPTVHESISNIKLRVPKSSISEKAHYSVRVHVDANGSGQVSKGDCVSTRSHPVLTFGHPDSVTVPLKYLA